jgi:hypothetical protein
MSEVCRELLRNHIDCLLLQRKHDDLVLKQKYTPGQFTLHDKEKLDGCAKKLTFCENSQRLFEACMRAYGLD